MKFRYTILYVDDVPASIDFFCRAFGFEKSFVHGSGDFGELATGETKLSFCSTALFRQLGKNPLKPAPGRPTFELAFETEDVHGAVERAVQAGALLVQDVREEAWGQTTAYVSDPNGYLIEICSAMQAS
ncbi:MAG: VOC family protein [Lautropia sp.]|nr:VOC family protein [Lautropia sp.]